MGNAAGFMARFDFRGRNAKQPIHGYRGFAGAVRDITVPRNEPYVLSVSLDRFLRVHHIYNGNLMFKVRLLLYCDVNQDVGSRT